MALPKKLLSRDEVIVRHMHTHPKVLLWRILLEILLLAVGIAASVMAPRDWGMWMHLVIWMVILVISFPLFLIPWLQWSTKTYTVTSKRIITRSGIFNKVGHDLPLSRISDVQHDSSITDRIFGAGTLSLQTSSNDPLLLEDVPKVEMVQVEISNLLFNDVQGAVDHVSDDDVGLGVDGLAHQVGGLVHLEQAQVGAALEEEQHAVGAVDRGLQQRRGDGLLGGRDRAPLTGGRADTHERAAGALHDGLDVVEVDVDETGGRDELGNALDTLKKNLVGLLEGVNDGDVLVGDLQEAVIGDDDEGVDFLAQRLDAVLGLGRAAASLEGEGTGDHTDGQRTDALGQAGDDGGCTGAGTASLARGDEDHVRAVESLADLGLVVLGGLAADRRVGSCPQAPGQVSPDVELDVSVGHEQRLGVGVHGDELHATQIGLDHAVDGVDAAAANTDDLDLCLVVL